MRFSNGAAARRPVAYLALVALLHLLALYLLFGQGVLQRKSRPAARVVYMDLQSIAAPRPLPAKAVVIAFPERPSVQRIAGKPHAGPPPAPASQDFPPEAAAVKEQAPANVPPQVARLDLDSLRALARANERQRELTPVERLRASQERDNSTEGKIAAAAKSAQRGDCRTVHADVGLFAPLLILKDSLTDKGCKW
ncbi:MAG: hypothetical protein V4634_07735 [Pseudomonadota bacterium]